MTGKGARDAGRQEEAATVAVHVLPRASREGVAGILGDAVRVRLTAPPLENRANEALVRFLADALGVPRTRVEIVAGRRGRRKIVRVGGISRGELLRRLGLEQPPE
ncbi:MAG TPA: DUF167 domain-containing protein [Candidatus Deferrimicrobiaceae bacterium]|nr:DUF167 domain-containing protein [Candidatus Deferrimicrobiaceae bacterium]